VAVDDQYSTTPATPISVSASEGVLSNDSDADGDSLSASLVSDATYGTLTLNSDGSFSYAPSTGFHGFDSFVYAVSDGIYATNGTVTITIDNAPTAADDQYSGVSIAVDVADGILNNDSDADGDALFASLISDATYGSLTLNSDGSFVYTPDAGFHGVDSFAYAVGDGFTSSIGTVSLTVNNVAPVATKDDYQTDTIGGTITRTVSQGVLSNDSDENGDVLSATLISSPQHGTLTLNSDGSFNYSADSGFHGVDNFVYRASDGLLDSPDTTVILAVANQKPVVTKPFHIPDTGTRVEIDAAHGLLANASDPDGDPLTASLVSGPAHGILTVHPDGSLIYIPEPGYEGAETFNYCVSDGTDNDPVGTIGQNDFWFRWYGSDGVDITSGDRVFALHGNTAVEGYDDQGRHFIASFTLGDANTQTGSTVTMTVDGLPSSIGHWSSMRDTPDPHTRPWSMDAGWNDEQGEDDDWGLDFRSDAPFATLPGCTSCGTKPGGPINASPPPSDFGPGPKPIVLAPSSPVDLGPTWSGGPSDATKFPVRYSDGTAYISSSDLSSDFGGIQWGVTRDWTNGSGYFSANTVGNGMVVEERPYLIQTVGDNPAIDVVSGGHTSYHFDGDPAGDAFTALAFQSNALTHDNDAHEYSFVDLTGAQLHFFDFSDAWPLAKQGQLSDYTNPSGSQVITLTYSSTGALSHVDRNQLVAGVTTNEQFLYSYVPSGVNAGLTASIELRRNTNTSGYTWQDLDNDAGSSDWHSVRSVEYTYYGSNDPNGNVGDLKLATIKELVTEVVTTVDGPEEIMVDATVDTTYYRYYTSDSSKGYTHGLKYVFNPASYARLLAAFSSQAAIDIKVDNVVKTYADNYFEYNIVRRVSVEIAQGAGCPVCANGLGTFGLTYEDRRVEDEDYHDGYNSWAVKTIETLPDADQNIVYTNYLGEVMLQIQHHPVFDEDLHDIGPQWITYYHYNANGQVDFRAEPSATTGYDPGLSDLIGFDSVNRKSDFIADSSGLITNYSFYGPDDVGVIPGAAKGHLKDVTIQQGDGGSATPQQFEQLHQTYTSHSDIAGRTIVLIASSTVYEHDDGTHPLTTAYSYTYYDNGNSNQVLKQTTTNTADDTSTYVVYDQVGRPIWTKDQGNFLNYMAYDPLTGAVIKTITDVNTSMTQGAASTFDDPFDLLASFVDKPSDWTTPSGGGLNITTVYEVDALGRPKRIEGPSVLDTFIVYNDSAHETRIYGGFSVGWGASGLIALPIGSVPTIVLRDDQARNYVEQLTMTATPNMEVLRNPDGTPRGFGIHPDGSEAISNVQSDSRTYFNNAGQATITDDYFNLDGLTYTPLAFAYGTIYTNFNRMTYGYDQRGRQNEIDRAVAPSNVMIYRTIYDTLDRPVSEWIGHSTSTMVEQRQYVYDGGGVGDSNLTAMIEYVNNSTTTTRTTTFNYDFRDRLIATTLPPSGPGNLVPVYQTQYDNLDRVFKQSDGTGSTDPAHMDDVFSHLGHYTTYDYKAAQRRVTTIGPDADGLSSTPNDAPTTVVTYNVRGLVSAQTDAMGNTTSFTYDSVGRGITMTAPQPDHTQSGPGPVTTYTYDVLGDLTSVTDPLGHVTTYGFDDLGRPIGSSDAATSVAYSYDSNGRVSGVIDQLTGGTTSYQYDALGRVTAETNQLGNTAHYQYDGLNRVSQKADRDGRITIYSYDLHDNVTAEKWYDLDGTTLLRTINYTYDNASQLTGASDQSADSSVPTTSYSYQLDALGQPIHDDQSIDGLNAALRYLSWFDKNGFRTQLSTTLKDTSDSSNPYTTDSINTYTPDNLQRLTSLVQQSYTSNGAAPKSVSFGYNNDNQFTQIDRYADTTKTDLAISSIYGYDDMGRLTSLLHTTSTPPATSTAKDYYQYLYDDASRITHMVTKFDGQTDYTYDDANQLTSGDGNSYAYQGSNGNSASDTFGPENQLLSDGTYTYSYDLDGNRIAKTNPATNEVTAYSYDYRNRLTTVTQAQQDTTTDGWGSSTGVLSFWATYPYTHLNRTFSATAASEGSDIVVTLGLSFGDADTVSYTLEDQTATLGTDYWIDPHNKLVSAGSISAKEFDPASFVIHTAPTFDGHSKSFAIHFTLTVYNHQTYEYETQEVTLEADIYGLTPTSSVAYTYDPFNQLVHRSFDDDAAGPHAATDTFYSYEHGQVAIQFDGPDVSNLSHRYLWGPAVDQLLADENVGGPLYWTLADQLGSIRDLATHDSTNGTLIANHRKYDAFGNVVSETTAALHEVFGFTGRQFDAATGLQYNLNRWYDPLTGRWISEDPIGFQGDSINLYRYADNTPTGGIDPDGLETIVLPRLPIIPRVPVVPRIGPRMGPRALPPTPTPKPGPAIDPLGPVPGGNQPPPPFNPSTQGGEQFDPCKGRLRYEPSPKHGPQQRGKASPAPTNGARSLEVSIPVKDTSRVRVAIDPITKEFVVFRETGTNTCVYHGYQVPWNELTQEMQNALKRTGQVNSKGKPLQGAVPGSPSDERREPTWWDRLRDKWNDFWRPPFPEPSDYFA
jgi:RHS repeat-associated protein